MTGQRPPVFEPTARLTPSEDLRVHHRGQVLVGGSPARLVRLTADGARLVAAWFDGRPIGPSRAERHLAGRLIDRGLAELHHHRPATDTPVDVTVVIPAHDEPTGLLATLHALSTDGDRRRPLPVVIVDDGSSSPIRADWLRHRLAEPFNLRLTVIRPTGNVGPAGARNRGVDAVDTERVLFVDAGVSISQASIRVLLAELADPSTVIVAPRVVSSPQAHPADRHSGSSPISGLIAGYERRWSPLDMGRRGGLVGPGRRLTYLPSTCLAVDTKTHLDMNGFDQDLRYGEDVDYMWRAGRRGRVRYLPEVVVSHPPRSRLTSFVSQRYHYGTAAGPLAVRHPGLTRSVTLAAAPTAFWCGLVSRRPLGAVVASLIVADTYRRLRNELQTILPPELPAGAVARPLLARNLVGSAIGIATAACRPWLPLLSAVGLISTGSRRLIGPVVAVGLARRTRPSTPGTILVDAVFGMIDDLAYSAGVWRGAQRSRVIDPILPRFGGSWRRSRATGR